MVKEHVEDDERVHVVVVGPARARPTNVATSGRSIADVVWSLDRLQVLTGVGVFFLWVL